MEEKKKKGGEGRRGNSGPSLRANRHFNGEMVATSNDPCRRRKVDFTVYVKPLSKQKMTTGG